MESILNGTLSEWIQRILAGIVCKNIQSTMQAVLSQAEGWSGDLGMEPSTYNSSMWSVIEAITDSAIAPVATLILTAVMLIELISWISTQNNLHTSSDVVGHFVRFFIKLFIGITLVSNAHDLTLMIFRLSSSVVANAGGALNADVTYNVLSASSIEAMRDQLAQQEIGDLIGMLLVSVIGLCGTFVISAVCRIIIIGRIIHIYMYCSIGAVPYATFMNKELSGIGMNYIKNLFALAFQGFFMLVAITIYGYLVATMDISSFEGVIDTFIGMFKLSLEYICYGFALCFALVGSKSLAKSIFNAH